MVEHDLAKVGVASSSLVSRSKIHKKRHSMSGVFLCVVFTFSVEKRGFGLFFRSSEFC
ncbi:hypothetical protein EMIT0P171_10121 [Pseudomonas sp. IT-P171]